MNRRFFDQKVGVHSGYFDGTTPFYGAEKVFGRVFQNNSRLVNLSFSHDPSGHMFYLDESSMDQFWQTAEVWYAKYTGSPSKADHQNNV